MAQRGKDTRPKQDKEGHILSIRTFSRGLYFTKLRRYAKFREIKTLAKW